MKMEGTLYENLRDEFFKLNYRKDQLNKEIEQLTSAKKEVETVIDELDFILSKHGTHVFNNYIENKGE